MKKLPRVLIRIDDIGKDNLNSEYLITSLCKLKIKVTCAVVPCWLTSNCINFLTTTSIIYPGFIEVHQHGFNHSNYSELEEEYEFGPNRSLKQQMSDIQEGRRILENSFNHLFFPIFTPPYNFFDENTIKALHELGYYGISSFTDHELNKILPEYSPDIDCFQWHPTQEKDWEKILFEWERNQNSTLRGFILHPHLMDHNSISSFIDNLKFLIGNNAITVTFNELING